MHPVSFFQQPLVIQIASVVVGLAVIWLTWYWLPFRMRGGRWIMGAICGLSTAIQQNRDDAQEAAARAAQKPPVQILSVCYPGEQEWLRSFHYYARCNRIVFNDLDVRLLKVPPQAPRAPRAFSTPELRRDNTATDKRMDAGYPVPDHERYAAALTLFLWAAMIAVPAWRRRTDRRLREICRAGSGPRTPEQQRADERIVREWGSGRYGV